MPDRLTMAPPIEETEPEEEEEEDVATSEDEDDETEEDAQESPVAEAGEVAGETVEEAERRRRKRRRRRRGGRREEPSAPDDTAAEPDAARTEAEPMREEIHAAAEPATEQSVAAEAPGGAEASEADETAPPSDDDPRNRRRGRRGGRRRRRDNEGDVPPLAVPGADQPDLLPVYAGPTPADPFGGRAFDIFDVMDQVERQAEAAPTARAISAAEIVNFSGPEPETSAVDVESEAPQAASVVGGDAAPSSAPEALHPATEILNATAPEPALEPSLAEAKPDPDIATVTVPTPANDVTADIVPPELPSAEPAIKPILVGAGGEPPAERKRGWWRR